jgi:hypothetical protein
VNGTLKCWLGYHPRLDTKAVLGVHTNSIMQLKRNEKHVASKLFTDCYGPHAASCRLMATKDILRIRVYHRRNYANKLKAQEQKARRGSDRLAKSVKDNQKIASFMLAKDK